MQYEPVSGYTGWKVIIDLFWYISDGVTRDKKLSRLSRLLCRWWENHDTDNIPVQQDPVADS